MSFVATGRIHLDVVEEKPSKSEGCAEENAQNVHNACDPTPKIAKRVSLVGLRPEDGNGPILEEDPTAMSQSEVVDSAETQRSNGEHPEKDTKRQRR